MTKMRRSSGSRGGYIRRTVVEDNPAPLSRKRIKIFIAATGLLAIIVNVVPLLVKDFDEIQGELHGPLPYHHTILLGILFVAAA